MDLEHVTRHMKEVGSRWASSMGLSTRITAAKLVEGALIDLGSEGLLRHVLGFRRGTLFVDEARPVRHVRRLPELRNPNPNPRSDSYMLERPMVVEENLEN